MNDHIEQLKKYKAPWWSRLLGWWRKLQRARLARKMIRHVAVITCWTRDTASQRVSASYLHLYQVGSHKRYYEYVEGPHPVPVEYFNFYNHYVVPWVKFQLGNDVVIHLAKELSKVPSDWS